VWEGRGGWGRVARVGWWKWVVEKRWESEMGGDRSKERGVGGFPAPNEQRVGVSKREKEQEGVSTHLCHWGLPRPSLHSSINKANGNVISDVPDVSAVVFAIQIGAAVKLREGGGGSGCGCDNSTTMTTMTTPSSWATLHVAFIPFVTTRPVRHR
jgi:hypothetical protein